MSGGAYDYAYFDAEILADTISDMEADMDRVDYPDEIEDRLARLRHHLEDERELLRTVEWVSSGDKSPNELEHI